MPLFTILPNAFGHLNSLFGGDNWAKCSTVMHPVSGMFFMMDQLVVWTKVWRQLFIDRSPSNIYNLPHLQSDGTPNYYPRNQENAPI